ncbi:hypothetical protein IFM89_000222 [Coptis chinensis]|uniref:Uncharacterized protein n=1 Tax=Coptis chinensis TaxID=261450 RepID=A0A835M3B7_9MAGN|nr:hypothetical protein IFM89_000222 [Coptis chinensis]
MLKILDLSVPSRRLMTREFHWPCAINSLTFASFAKNGCTGAARMLLEYGASVEAKAKVGFLPFDNFLSVPKGLSPLNRLSRGTDSKKLHELVHSHLVEQRKCKGIATSSMMYELEDEISSIIGLNDLREQLRKWAKGMILDEKRRALRLKIGALRAPHMAFLGNPGTGNFFTSALSALPALPPIVFFCKEICAPPI